MRAVPSRRSVIIAGLLGVAWAVVLLGAGLRQGRAADPTVTATATTTTAPSSQPAQVAVTVVVPPPSTQMAEPESLVEAMSHTRLGRLFRDQEQVKPEQLLTFAFWIDTVRDLVVTLVAFIPRLAVAIIFFLIFWGIYRVCRRLILGSLKQADNVDTTVRDLLGTLVKWAFLGFGLVIACNQVGIQITALLTGVSIIGLAIGFAAQDTISNFIAAVVIFWDSPFKIGDWIEIEGIYAKVQRVTFRSTRLLMQNGEVIVMPNTRVNGNRISNHSTNPINRLAIPVTLPAEVGIDQGRELLLNLAKGDPRVVTHPAPTVVVCEASPGAAKVMLRFWIRDEAEELNVFHDYVERIKKVTDSAAAATTAAAAGTGETVRKPG